MKRLVNALCALLLLLLFAGADSQTILAGGTNTPFDVNANRTDPSTMINGGVAEFEPANPTNLERPL